MFHGIMKFESLLEACNAQRGVVKILGPLGSLLGLLVK